MMIGQASAASDVSQRMVRHYEKIGLIPTPLRRNSGYWDSPAFHRSPASPRPSICNSRSSPLDGFEVTGTPINEGLVHDLAGGAFLASQRNVVLVGGTGSGKTHLSIAITRLRATPSIIPPRRKCASNPGPLLHAEPGPRLRAD